MDSFISESIRVIQGNDLLNVIAVAVGALIVGIIVKYIIKFVANNIAKKTKSELDDKIIHALENPILFTILVAGIFFALLTVGSLEPYRDKIWKATTVAGIFLGTYMGVKVINVVFRHSKKQGLTIADKKVDMKYSNIVRRVINIIIYSIAGLLILTHLGVKITPLIGALGIGGLAVALALQDTLNNFFSGFYIISEKQVGIADFVEIQGEDIKGFIDDIGWRTTRIKNINNNFIVIPNSKLSQATIVNYTKPDEEYTMPIPVGVTYDSDLDKAEKVALKVAERIQKTEEIAVDDFEPWLSYSAFGDSSINFTVGLRVKSYIDRFRIRHLYIKALKEEYRKNRIEIAFPTRTVYLKK